MRTGVVLDGSTNKAQALVQDDGPWWRQPYCWLVIVGPLVVVFAGFATAYIAYEGADSLNAKYVMDRRHVDTNNAKSMQPAQAARNGVSPQR